jgi:hypothetical protein
MKSRTFRRMFAWFAEKQISEAPKVALLLLTLALPAVAQKPTIQLIPLTSVFVPAAAACGFDVLFTPQAGRPNKERLIQFANTEIIAGPLFVTIKNLSTGKTIDVNISGPSRTSFSSTTATVVATGASIQIFFPANVLTAAGLPPLPLIHGQIVFTLDDQDNVTSIQSVTGTVQDVCQLLQ